MRKNCYPICRIINIIFHCSLLTGAIGQSKSTILQRSRRIPKVKKFSCSMERTLITGCFISKILQLIHQRFLQYKDGVIHISGDPFGYMRTKEIYSDYKLHVEWRWPDEATNSGVFVHAATPDAIWLKCIECQLKAGSAGDFVCMSGADMTEHKDKSAVVS